MNMNKCSVPVNGASIMQNVGTLYCIDRSVVASGSDAGLLDATLNRYLVFISCRVISILGQTSVIGDNFIGNVHLTMFKQ